MKKNLSPSLIIVALQLTALAVRAQTYNFSIFAGRTNVTGSSDGPGTAALFNQPHGLAVDPLDNLYVADTGNGRIRLLTPDGFTVSLTNLFEPVELPFNPNGPNPALAILRIFSFTAPLGIAVQGTNHLYVSDSNVIYSMGSGSVAWGVAPLAGGAPGGFVDGTGTNAAFAYAYGLTLDSQGNLYVADEYNYSFRKVTPAGVVTTPILLPIPGVAVSGPYLFDYHRFSGVAMNASNDLYLMDTTGYLNEFSHTGEYSSFSTFASSTTESQGLAVDKAGNVYIVADPSNTLVRINPAGVATNLGMLPVNGRTAGLAVDSYRDVYLADLDDNVILQATPPVPAAFFNGQVRVGGGQNYLQFANNVPFGYYDVSTFDFPLFYHDDLGFEYFFDANDGKGGAYFYDFASSTFWFTSPKLFPYLYDFSLNTWLYYYRDSSQAGHYTSNPRYFYNFGNGQIITK